MRSQPDRGKSCASEQLVFAVIFRLLNPTNSSVLHATCQWPWYKRPARIRSLWLPRLVSCLGRLSVSLVLIPPQLHPTSFYTWPDPFRYKPASFPGLRTTCIMPYYTPRPRHDMTSRTRISTPRTPSRLSPDITEIIPRLYMSDLSCAENPALLAALGITHVLSAMRGTVMVPPSVQQKQIALEDHPFAELAAHLPGATSFVHDALRDGNAKVLVHCAQGVSRSASVVCAFLIAAYGWTPQQAVQFVKEKRPSAEPNFGFVSQLKEYADSIRTPSRS
ncbi:phosphatases II [Neolentinus lepideus HHB14362 ss-1]|uniref:protein-tyrosine-phosphatase n=1 Tax=Neolentinus lepideus HHB14362 ss-1 TaxID=1314782 RepID=A0A165N8N6_9AGAM|nr:phosphatases II [Neolentinus lepideus HHB14362 ss-1]